MDTNSFNDTAISVTETDSSGRIDKGKPEDETKVRREVGSALIRLELDIACCSEKLANINLLMMHVAARESDFEDFLSDKDTKLVDSDKKALEFDILSGIFDSEVKEMESFIGKIQLAIDNTHKVIYSHKEIGEGFLALEEKLYNAEESIMQSQEQVSELMMQSTKFQKILSSVNQEETSDEDKGTIISADGTFFNMTVKLKMQTSQQQRNILRMLEKSLARELELENEVKECMQARDEMKFKVHHSQQKLLTAEETTIAVYARFLEADNASTVFMGISKEFIGKLQSCQLQTNSALRRENELNTKLLECTQIVQTLEKKEASMQELAEKNRLEALALKEKVNFLEEQLKASESAQVNGNASLVGKSEQIKELEEKFFIAESRAQKAEDKSKLLVETNNELNVQLDLLQNSGVSFEKLDSLEKQLRETEIQLQEKMASVEASQEKQTLLYSSINDMELLIEDLKSKVAEASARADSAEDKCIALSEKQQRETDIQLQEAKASVEANQENQTLLYSSINDMEILIEKLKSKVIEANAQADSAEDKCVILSESHAELNEELIFLRGKIECLEASLQQAEDTKRATAKDIDIRSKVITDMVMQLAVERERLHKQLSLLMMKNRALVDKLRVANKESSNSMNHKSGESEKEVLSSVHRVHSADDGRGNIEDFNGIEVEKSTEDVLDSECESEPQDLDSKLETVRTIDAGRLNVKYVISASFIVLVAVLVVCFLQPGNCLF